MNERALRVLERGGDRILIKAARDATARGWVVYDASRYGARVVVPITGWIEPAIHMELEPVLWGGGGRLRIRSVFWFNEGSLKWSGSGWCGEDGLSDPQDQKLTWDHASTSPDGYPLSPIVSPVQDAEDLAELTALMLEERPLMTALLAGEYRYHNPCDLLGAARQLV